MRLPDPCLVVLVGASGAGKSHWAAQQFHPDAIVSSDRLRAVVGRGERDQRASKDAFDVLDLIVERRTRRKLVTVIDTLGLDHKRRQKYLQIATRNGIPAHAVVLDTDAKTIRQRNRANGNPVPPKVVSAQLESLVGIRAQLAKEGFTVHAAGERVQLVPPAFLTALTSAQRQREAPMTLEFGLQLPKFNWPDTPQATAGTLAEVAQTAERIGFTNLWVMDHLLQIPQVGREWEDMLESYTTLGYLAGQTKTATLGTMVTGITYRNIAHLAKIIATVDVLSGGRAVAGLGAAWFEQEHERYGWEFPPLKQRFDRLEDALELLPLMWGKGTPPYKGRTTEIPAATCYPRPLQDRIPILIGGSGEKKTLKLVARHADMCNFFGGPEVVRHKLEVLKGHCENEGRDVANIKVTHLGAAQVIEPGEDRPHDDAATIDELIGRYRELAEAGVQTAIISLTDVSGPEAVEAFAPLIEEFKRT